MNLPEQKKLTIQAKLPNVLEIQRQLLLPVDAIAMKTGPHKRIDSAIVCLKDASHVAGEVVYALSQAYTCLIWYREEHPQAPLEREACIYSKFYIDDVALRLYAAAEHIANFIINFLDIKETVLKTYNKKHVALHVQIGKYMMNTMPTHEITVGIRDLINSKYWIDTIDYRNTLVHEQPPLIEGIGILYNRKSKWVKKDQRGYFLTGGGGDSPEYTIDILLEMVSSAAHAFTMLLSKLSSILVEYLKSIGIEFIESGKIKFQLF